MVVSTTSDPNRLGKMIEENDLEEDPRQEMFHYRTSVYSSLESLDPETLVAEHFGSQDLDKLSGCLSEVSSDSEDSGRGGLLYEILQAQLALWTLVFSVLYSYAWKQHRKKFLMSLFFVVPAVLTVYCGMSALLTTIVILGRVFSTPLGYGDILKFNEDATTGQICYPRRRTYSNSSRKTSAMSSRSTLSSEDVRVPSFNDNSESSALPVPLCRRHSSHGSLNGNALFDMMDKRQLSVDSSQSTLSDGFGSP